MHNIKVDENIAETLTVQTTLTCQRHGLTWSSDLQLVAPTCLQVDGVSEPVTTDGLSWRCSGAIYSVQLTRASPIV